MGKTELERELPDGDVYMCSNDREVSKTANLVSLSACKSSPTVSGPMSISSTDAEVGSA